MKKLSLFPLLALAILIACSLLLAGCSKDAAIDSFMSELDATMAEVTKKIDADPGADGIAAAQKIFDAKKSSLKTDWDKIKGIMDMQVSAGKKQKLANAVIEKRQALYDASIRNVNRIAKDEKAAAELQALIKDYEAIFALPEPKPAPPVK